MTKAQEVYERVEALVASGVSKADAFRQVADEYGQPFNSMRGAYYAQADAPTHVVGQLAAVSPVNVPGRQEQHALRQAVVDQVQQGAVSGQAEQSMEQNKNKARADGWKKWR